MVSPFVVRPSNTDKDPFRVKFNAVSLLALKLKPGDVCELQSQDQAERGRKRLAVAFEASGAGIKDTIVQTSKVLQEAYNIKLGDKISIARVSTPIPDAQTISLSSDSIPGVGEDKLFWEKYMQLAVSPLNEYLAVNQRLEFKLGNESIALVVKDIGDPESAIAKLTKSTSYRIITTAEETKTDAAIEFKPTRLGGVERQVQQMQEIITRLCRPVVKEYFDLYRPVQGLLLYGAKGTGKTALIDVLAGSGWSAVVHWKSGTKLPSTNAPRLIIVKPIDILRNSSASNKLAEIEELFKQVRETTTLVIAEVRHPNDVEPSLRSEGMFAAEVEVPIPSAHQRKEILLALRGISQVPNDALLQEMADRTHGYVGADIYALLRRTLELACESTFGATTEADVGILETIEGDKPSLVDGATSPIQSDIISKPRPLTLTSADLSRAMQEVRPSALQEIFLETPNVHWSDIGGQHEIKRRLQNAIERPLKYADRMKILGLQPKKGVLLYGPPGCSKTLLVRALATEAGLNFLAVKGAELISMYVGESERATREVFRKARAASPSIVFFDEIDAIASRGKSGSDLNVLTTLLNEMDGFEELRNVLIVAATNKPQNIDPALMRPGRFDNVVYIGPPDIEARSEIFQKNLRKFRFETEKSVDQAAEEFAKVTDGFSGAEIVAICQTAAEYAFDADRDYVLWDDMTKAISNTPKSITKAMLLEFESWNSARMR